jgi:hypothetical protein
MGVMKLKIKSFFLRGLLFLFIGLFSFYVVNSVCYDESNCNNAVGGDCTPSGNCGIECDAAWSGSWGGTVLGCCVKPSTSSGGCCGCWIHYAMLMYGDGSYLGRCNYPNEPESSGGHPCQLAFSPPRDGNWHTCQAVTYGTNNDYSWLTIELSDSGTHNCYKSPNCRNLHGPSSLNVGQTGTYTATFDGNPGLFDRIGLVIYRSTCDNVFFNSAPSVSNPPVTRSFSWTPSSPGTYTAYCKSWNDGVEECRGDCVTGPPVYDCAGPNDRMTINVVTTTTTSTTTTTTTTTSSTTTTLICDGTDTSCGVWPACTNCNNQDGCYAYSTGCEMRNYYCINNPSGCGYSTSNRHTDYHNSFVNYCSGDSVRRHRRFHNYYCDGGSCLDHTSWVDDSLVENCNNRDGWTSYSCQSGNVRYREYRDYTCSGGSCTFSVTSTDSYDCDNEDDNAICNGNQLCQRDSSCSSGTCSASWSSCDTCNNNDRILDDNSWRDYTTCNSVPGSNNDNCNSVDRTCSASGCVNPSLFPGDAGSSACLSECTFSNIDGADGSELCSNGNWIGATCSGYSCSDDGTDDSSNYQCIDGDGCCPNGCNNINDNDCSTNCGNGIVESGEDCDSSTATYRCGSTIGMGNDGHEWKCDSVSTNCNWQDQGCTSGCPGFCSNCATLDLDCNTPPATCKREVSGTCGRTNYRFDSTCPNDEICQSNSCRDVVPQIISVTPPSGPYTIGDTINMQVRYSAGGAYSGSWGYLVECRMIDSGGCAIDVDRWSSASTGDTRTVTLSYTTSGSDAPGTWTLDYCVVATDYVSNGGWSSVQNRNDNFVVNPVPGTTTTTTSITTITLSTTTSTTVTTTTITTTTIPPGGCNNDNMCEPYEQCDCPILGCSWSYTPDEDNFECKDLRPLCIGCNYFDYCECGYDPDTADCTGGYTGVCSSDEDCGLNQQCDCPDSINCGMSVLNNNRCYDSCFSCTEIGSYEFCNSDWNRYCYTADPDPEIVNIIRSICASDAHSGYQILTTCPIS